MQPQVRQNQLMTHTFSERAGKGNAGKCYAARLDKATSGRLAWCRVDGKRESLHLRANDATTRVADRDTYLADHCLAGGALFRSRRDGPQSWSLRTGDAVVPTGGRAISLSSCGDLPAWEERLGKRTRVRLLRVDVGKRIEHRWIVTRKRPGEFRYARVLLESGEIVLTSPVWLDA